jgi:MinD superfamily P-loop ATPase
LEKGGEIYAKRRRNRAIRIRTRNWKGVRYRRWPRKDGRKQTRGWTGRRMPLSCLRRNCCSSGWRSLLPGYLSQVRNQNGEKVRGYSFMIVSIASGKGGTGKTTFAVSLGLSLGKVEFLDCDVEEPNASIFLKPSITRKTRVTVPEPWVDESKCTYCGECAKICAFHAIAVFGKSVLVFHELCHGCGGCWLICPEKAIKEGKREVGVIEEGRSGLIHFIQGIMKVGEHMTTPVIRKEKDMIRKDMDVIIDAPPGSSCPMIESIKGSDFVFLVTEPTPFGLNDLKLAVDVVRKLKIPYGVVINCDGIGDDRVKTYCQEEEIPLLLSIPWDRQIAEAYSKGIPATDVFPDLKVRLRFLFQEISGLIHNRKTVVCI